VAALTLGGRFVECDIDDAMVRTTRARFSATKRVLTEGGGGVTNLGVAFMP
jgi:hypothetical protein